MKKSFLFTLIIFLLITLISCKTDSSEHTHIADKSIAENYVESNCINNGGYDIVIYCKECGDELSREYVTIEKKEHTPTTVIENEIHPTCTTNGSYDEIIYCSYDMCGELISKTNISVEALGHSLGNWEITKEASCEEDGMMTGTCRACGVVGERYIPRLNHSDKPEIGDPSLHKAEGTKGSFYLIYKCTNCNSWVVAYRISDDGLPENPEKTYTDLIYKKVNGGYEVTGLKDTDATIISIPEIYNELPVIGIGEKAFMGYDEITHVTIPHTVQYIDNQAFNGCMSLICVTIDKGNDTLSGISLSRIEKIIFFGCPQVSIVYEGSMADFKSIKKQSSPFTAWNKDAAYPFIVYCDDGRLEYGNYTVCAEPQEYPKEIDK